MLVAHAQPDWKEVCALRAISAIEKLWPLLPSRDSRTHVPI